MRPAPNDQERAIMAHNQFLAPADGSPFHDPGHLAVFQAQKSSEYLPSLETAQRLAGLQRVASIMGPFAVGKNGAKGEAIIIASHADYEEAFPGGVHEVLNGTTRLPEFRDGRVEDHTSYLFCFDKATNQQLVQWLQNGELVQWAQPRGDHVYFSWIGSFPTKGVALMDTVPATLDDLNRVLALGGSQERALGLYRTVRTFDEWWDRIVGRGDIIGPHGKIIDPDNYFKRMNEAMRSLVEAMDNRERLIFFEAEERPDAGKKVLDILQKGYDYPAELQRSAIDGAYSMIKGLEELKIKQP